MKRSDHCVWLRNTFAVTALAVLIGFAAAPRVVRAACTGDCGNISKVTVADIVTMVDIALGTAQLSECTAGDANNDKVITVDEILQAVDNALNDGCGAIPGCGNGVVDTGEECDDGGTCIGGTNAGTHCTAESDCIGNGVCKAGSNGERACDPTNPDACPGSTCQKCIPQGGDGCASNCTTETTVQMPLKPGELLDPTIIKAGTSGSTVWNAVLGPLALSNVGTQNLVVGKERDGQVPLVINYSHLNEIDVSGLSCACVRGIGDMTCGGTIFEADGTTLTTDCTPHYIMGTCSNTTPKSCTVPNQSTDCPDSVTCVGGICANCHTDNDCASGQTCVMHACDGKKPCTLVQGVGGTCSVTKTKTCRVGSTNPANQCPPDETCVRTFNLSSGIISCVTGMKGTNMLMTEDSKRADGQEDPPQCNYNDLNTYVQGSTFPDCGSNPVVTLSDQNPAPVGSVVIINSTAIGQFVGPCSGNPARPANFCTDQEAWGLGRGMPNTLPGVTGTACAEMSNIFLGGATTTDSICNCADPSFFSCPPSQCNGPHCVSGSPISSCGQLLANPPNVSGLGAAGAFTALANPTIGDEVITDLLQAGTWTTLAASISATDTTLTLVDASSFPSSGNASISRPGLDSEEFSYTGKSGNQLTGATRGINQTTAAAHSAGEPVVW